MTSLERRPSDLGFNEVYLLPIMNSLSDTDLDKLTFGVIGFDDSEKICRYNAPEARWAGLDRDVVIGGAMFEVVAPCMNNFMIAERFKHARESSEALDSSFPYVLTLRMRPTPCILRLLADPSSPVQYILIQRKSD
jgi:photoactive yellow protein